MQTILTLEYWMYFKEKWCRTAGKDPLFGHVDSFQIDPSMKSALLKLCEEKKGSISQLSEEIIREWLSEKHTELMEEE